MRGFASDNYAGIHPEVMAAILAANTDHARAYGDDAWTARAVDSLRHELDAPDAHVLITFNGTGANVVALQSIMRPWDNVICAATAHINTDECGAPEKALGSKLVDVVTPDGKLTPELVRAAALGRGDVHHTQPKVVSITQSTELGTLYQPHEIAALAAVAHELDMYLHLDGARISNAAAALGCGFADITSKVGVDVVSFGGTKNGLMGAEAVVFLRPELGEHAPFIRKQSMQLASKMRFASAQLVALLTDELWRRNAEHSNAMAQRLAAAVATLPGVALVRPVQANGVFVTLPPSVVEPLAERFPFYVWDAATTEVRWMCSWDTTDADIDAFVAALTELIPVPVGATVAA